MNRDAYKLIIQTNEFGRNWKARVLMSTDQFSLLDEFIISFAWFIISTEIILITETRPLRKLDNKKFDNTVEHDEKFCLVERLGKRFFSSFV